MPIKLPQEHVKIDGATLPGGGSDHLISEFLEIGFVGYLYLQTNEDKGLVLFENDQIVSAYHAKDNQIVGTSVHALLAFRSFRPKDCRVWVSEVPSEYLRYIKALYLGNELVPPTATNILNIQSIHDTFKEKIINGLLFISSFSEFSVVTINDSKWAFGAGKDEFQRVFLLDGCLLALYEIGESEVVADGQQDIALSAYSTMGKRIKETIIRNLESYFGKAAQSAINDLSGVRFSPNNYEDKLNELAKFLKLFVSDKKAKPFIEETNNEIQKMMEEVSI